MTSIKKTALASLCALATLGVVSNAHATVFAGSATFADTTTTNLLTVTDYKSPLSFSTNSLNATSGGDCGVASNCQYFTGFMTLETTVVNQDGHSINNSTTLTDQISLIFNWTSPSTAANTTFAGAVSETVFNQVKNDDGSLTWANDIHSDKNGKYAEQIVTFADGAKIAIDLYDAGLDGSTSALSGQFDMQICDLKDPTAVPEPASMALLGVGMIGTGVIARRRRQSSTTATAG
jgi:hypothetical protein